MAEPTDISGPQGLPFIGNMLDLQGDIPVRAIERISDIHGPIFKIRTPGRETVVVSGFELFDELCDETRFYKLLGGKLRDLNDHEPGRAVGLFTQYVSCLRPTSFRNTPSLADALISGRPRRRKTGPRRIVFSCLPLVHWQSQTCSTVSTLLLSQKGDVGVES